MIFEVLDEDCNTASDGCHLLPRMGGSKRYLDGLYKTGQDKLGLADFYHRLVINLRYLGFLKLCGKFNYG